MGKMQTKGWTFKKSEGHRDQVVWRVFDEKGTQQGCHVNRDAAIKQVKGFVR